jgi:DNA-binding transcriptional LysR family regulator
VHPLVVVRLRVKPRGSADLVEALHAGSLDVAFVSLADPTLVLHPIARDPLALLLPVSHPLAAGPLTLADVAAETWIDAPPGFGNRTVVDAAFNRAGLTREVALEVADAAWVPAFVAAGLGIGFVPATIPSNPKTTTRHELPDADLRWPLYLATTRDRLRRPSINAFLALLTDT